MLFRTVRGEDIPALLKIYAQYIDTPVTFEYALPSAAEFSERVAAVAAFYPWLVCEEGGECVGYAYAHRMQERAAYAWNAELSVYLGKEYCGRGIGKNCIPRSYACAPRRGSKRSTASLPFPTRTASACTNRSVSGAWACCITAVSRAARGTAWRTSKRISRPTAVRPPPSARFRK